MVLDVSRHTAHRPGRSPHPLLFDMRGIAPNIVGGVNCQSQLGSVDLVTLQGPAFFSLSSASPKRVQVVVRSTNYNLG